MMSEVPRGHQGARASHMSGGACHGWVRHWAHSWDATYLSNNAVFRYVPLQAPTRLVPRQKEDIGAGAQDVSPHPRLFQKRAVDGGW
ncbi:unnamed protein product, partial [Mesorhabditis spiculigera]